MVPTKQRTTRMMSLIRDIAPLPRMVVSDGINEAFSIIKKTFPEVFLHTYPSGMHCEDWEVPLAWQVTKGLMKNTDGKIIVSLDENLLFVAPYSEPVDGWFTKKEIEPHLRTQPDRPEAFSLEHIHAYDYHHVDWGITLPHKYWRELPEGKYHIIIETKTRPDEMVVGEWFVPGEKEQIVCICAHIDELCNDDLSGCVVGLELMDIVSQQSQRQFSYQLLLVPEMFGPLFYIDSNRERVDKTIGMLNLEALGAGEKFCLKHSLQGDTWFDNVLALALKERDLPVNHLSFFEGYGNDERVYEWPTVGIPGVALQQYPFKEYHTSDDTPDIIDPRQLSKALDVCESFVGVLENDQVPHYTTSLQPWLTKRQLYCDDTVVCKKQQPLLFAIDGKRSLSDLAIHTGLAFSQVKTFLYPFMVQKIIDYHSKSHGHK